MNLRAMTQGTAWDNNVDDRIRLIAKALAKNDDVGTKLPGLKALLDDYLDEHVEVQQQDFHRRLLQVFRDSEVDNTYRDLLGQFSAEEQTRISKFVGGEDVEHVCSGFQLGLSKGVREHIETMLSAEAVHISSAGPIHVSGLSMGDLEEKDGPLHRFVHAIAELFVDTTAEKDTVLVYKDAEFQNWGLVVDYVPTYTCVPSSVAGIQRIVKYAKTHDMGVRCSGYRHSWAPIFGRNGQILISFIGLREATQLPNTTSLPLPETAPTELESIELVRDGKPRVAGNALVRVGAGTTNERLRRWCVEHGTHTLPLNVIMVEITLGGSNGPICHGAGRAHATLSDLVRRVEYVDCHGERRSVDDPALLRAAAGCFGLMGPVTHLTLELSPMTYAKLRPRKIPVVRAVPPPDDVEVPPALRVVPALTPQQRADDIAAFENQCANAFYSEWFWFPYADNAWVNCWDDTSRPTEPVVDYPDPGAIFFQFVSQFALEVVQNAPVLGDLDAVAGLAEATVTLCSRLAMFALPEEDATTYLPDALHFRRGIQNIRVRDMEVELPVPARKGSRGSGGSSSSPGAPDWDVVRRAWWDAILVCYAHSDTAPQRMPLEMRIMGGSDIVMAPQRGNELATCSIEVLTLHGGVTDDEWKAYAQAVLDRWMSYSDAEGRPLRTRPHWAKQWAGFEVGGQPWVGRLKEVDYKDEIVEFKTLLAAIGKLHGWTLADIKSRFSNDFFDSFYFDDVGMENGVH